MSCMNDVDLTGIERAGPGCSTEAVTRIFIFLRDAHVKGKSNKLSHD